MSQRIHLTMFLFQIFSLHYFYGSTKINTHLIEKSRERNGKKLRVVVNHEYLLNRYTKKYKVSPR